MDPVRLKREFGRDLVFWGGGVDTQHTMAFGTPAQVAEEVRERVRIFNEGGGGCFPFPWSESSLVLRPGVKASAVQHPDATFRHGLAVAHEISTKRRGPCRLTGARRGQDGKPRHQN